MKNNQLATMFLGLLFLSTAFSSFLILRYNSALHRLQNLQPQLVAESNARSLIQAIMNDTIEYSKTHPDINKVLQPYTIGGKPAAPASAAAPKTTK